MEMTSDPIDITDDGNIETIDLIEKGVITGVKTEPFVEIPKSEPLVDNPLIDNDDSIALPFRLFLSLQSFHFQSKNQRDFPLVVLEPLAILITFSIVTGNSLTKTSLIPNHPTYLLVIKLTTSQNRNTMNYTNIFNTFKILIGVNP